MDRNSFLRSPKKEEQDFSDNIVVPEFSSNNINAREEIDVTDEFQSYLGIEEDEGSFSKEGVYGELSWDFVASDWDEYPNGECEEGVDYKVEYMNSAFFEEDKVYSGKVVKRESVGFWEDDEKKVSLNLNLNYQEVLDAWSDRGPLLAGDDCYRSVASNGCLMGEVAVMEEERRKREASVMRYKEKRQSRLFSKKIRYQVRKLNADKRPRLKSKIYTNITNE
ncbi:hypothetical protein K2173_007645 [Erythroxylum novogranatense]|uniref:CCT domain-containing protein n=1 Tax=Erythroxylum novogranatense TaxID=1862640 RepID=A0AAV8TV31_9ROSI|nr:hypothetical protein K2173_007645 [Erythroxylum novogranatense]